MVGRERRFEEIDSGDEVEGDIPAFLNPSGGSTSKRPRQSPSRKPRSTYHEKVGDGGFIFTIDSSSSSSNAVASSSSSSSQAQQRSVPGSKGRPTSQSETLINNDSQQSGALVATNGTRSASINNSKGDTQQIVGVRSPPAAKKTMRRSSLLKDGTSAIPHPHVPDDKLHRHCSGELVPEERVKHLTVWTLERSRKELKRQGMNDTSAKYYPSLLSALKYTLQDVNKGTLKIDWDSKGKERARDANSKSKNPNGAKVKLPPHPLNESNKKQESILKNSVKELQKQDKARKQAEEDLETFEKETERLRTQVEDQKEDEEGETEGSSDVIVSDMWEDEWTLEDRVRLKQAAKAVTSTVDDAAIATESEQKAILAAAALFLHNSEGTLGIVDEAGREADLRWNDVEFNVDLLRSKSHSLAQLSNLSQRYIAAVSARGAKALKEMTSSSKASSSRGIAPSSSTSSHVDSTVGRESRNNIERILSSLRSIEAERSVEDANGDNRLHTVKHLMGQGIGDVSEGDLLRAYAELS